MHTRTSIFAVSIDDDDINAFAAWEKRRKEGKLKIKNINSLLHTSSSFVHRWLGPPRADGRYNIEYTVHVEHIVCVCLCVCVCVCVCVSVSVSVWIPFKIYYFIIIE